MREENQTIIKALNMFGRVPETWELLNEIERLNNIINELEKDLIDYFKKEYADRKLEDCNLENCTYDYALVMLGKLKKLKEGK